MLIGLYKNIHKKWTFLIHFEAVGIAHVPISHVHIQHGRLLTYYWYIFKTSYIPKCQ